MDYILSLVALVPFAAEILFHAGGDTDGTEGGGGDSDGEASRRDRPQTLSYSWV